MCADGLVGQGVAFAFKPNQAHAICSVFVDLAEELQARQYESGYHLRAPPVGESLKTVE